MLEPLADRRRRTDGSDRTGTKARPANLPAGWAAAHLLVLDAEIGAVVCKDEETSPEFHGVIEADRVGR